MTKVERADEVEDYLHYLNQVADHITRSFAGPVPPITVLGFSQGATTASRWVTLGNLPAKKLILWAGTVAHDLDFDKYTPTLNALNPSFVVGDKDYYITPERLEQEKAFLQSHNLKVDFIPFAGEHRLNKEVLQSIAD